VDDKSESGAIFLNLRCHGNHPVWQHVLGKTTVTLLFWGIEE